MCVLRRWLLNGLAVLAFASFGRAAEEKCDPPTISVTGTGMVATVPDVADVRVGVRTHGATARGALSENNTAASALHATLKERGVAAKDVQTSDIQVSPQYSQPAGGRRPPNGEGDFVPRLAGYRVDNSVLVTVRELDKLGPLLDALVQGGANQIDGIWFRVDESGALLDEARKKAVADARRKAKMLAEEAGVLLGPARMIREEGEADPHWPTPTRAANYLAGSAPIAAGQKELRVTVRVDFELRAPK